MLTIKDKKHGQQQKTGAAAPGTADSQAKGKTPETGNLTQKQVPNASAKSPTHLSHIAPASSRPASPPQGPAHYTDDNLADLRAALAEAELKRDHMRSAATAPRLNRENAVLSAVIQDVDADKVKVERQSATEQEALDAEHESACDALRSAHARNLEDLARQRERTVAGHGEEEELAAALRELEDNLAGQV